MELEKFSFFKSKKELFAEAKEGLKENGKSSVLINFIFWLSKLIFLAGLTFLVLFFVFFKERIILYAILAGSFLFVAMLTYGPLKVSVAKHSLNMVEDTNPTTKDLGYGFKVKYFRNLWYGVTLFFRYIFFLILLIFPAILKYLDYSVSAFILAEDKEISVGAALKKSSLISKGRRSSLFSLIFSFFGKFILCLITVFIYALFVRPQYNAVLYCFYRDIKE